MSPLIFVRFCPQGLPSGRSTDDMLLEVRKEAYNMKYLKTDKCNTSTNVPDDDDEDAEEPASISSDASSDWFPQEWIGWTMYGVSSDHPTEHWVNQPISDGPTQGNHDFKVIRI